GRGRLGAAAGDPQPARLSRRARPGRRRGQVARGIRVNLSRTLIRAGAVLASAALLVPAASAPGSAAAARSDTVLMSVRQVSPATPKPFSTPSPLSVTLQLTSTARAALKGVRRIRERG